MASTLRHLSPAEYLTRERGSAGRHEYIDGELRPMAGASRLHSMIVGWVVTLLNMAFADHGFEVHSNDLRVRIPEGPYYYPDVVVAPSPPELEDEHQDTLLNPLIIFEVLSPSELFYRGEKLDNYRTIPSLTDYLLVFQDRRRVEHYSRMSDDEWRVVSYDAPEDVISLDSVGGTLKIEDVYRRWNDLKESQTNR